MRWSSRCAAGLAVGVFLAVSATEWAQQTSQPLNRPQQVPQPQPRMPPEFVRTCSLCHGADARGTDRGPNLVRSPDLAGMQDTAIAEIIRKGRNLMPAFPLPDAELAALTRYLRLLSPAEAPTKAVADTGVITPGEKLFFGSARCSTCHSVRGRGGVNGPDLSDIGTRLRPQELDTAITDPNASIAPGYGMVTVSLRNGTTLTGFARAERTHDLVLQTANGKLISLTDSEWDTVAKEKESAMPEFHGTPEERAALVDWMTTLHGASVGALKTPQQPVNRTAMDRVLHPVHGEWPTYNGRLDGNRYSDLKQINTATVVGLRPVWTYTMQFNGLETTPLVVDGMMYVTGNNQVCALDARTGAEMWEYIRPKSPSAAISSDSAIGVNRGVALLGDRLFYMTDDAHLLALSRLTGTVLWDVSTPEGTGRYGGTSAPLVVGDLVVTGVSGGDDGIRGFIAAYKATSGELVWRTWTVPLAGEPGAETWKGKAIVKGGGSTWLTGSYDAATGVLYWAVGNPHPDTDADERVGSNLWTNSDLALDPKTGKILWYYQFTPHDLHDWDANEPIVLVDTTWRGTPHKLLLHANRNGFFYVLDRETHQPLLASQMVKRMTWASQIDPKTWTPELLPANETSVEGVVTCPAVRGATNWYSTTWSPETRLYYVMTVEDCGKYRKAQNGGFGRFNDPAHPAEKVLRALDIETGKPAWELSLPGNVQQNYSGVLATAGGLVFFGDNDGGFAAVDAKTGKYFWHFNGTRPMKSSPMTYAIRGKQYVTTAAGSEIVTFALPDEAGAP